MGLVTGKSRRVFPRSIFWLQYLLACKYHTSMIHSITYIQCTIRGIGSVGTRSADLSYKELSYAGPVEQPIHLASS